MEQILHPDHSVTTLRELTEARRQQAALYLEFLRVPAMSAGLYELEAGAADPQTPHAEDELYYVVSGRGQIRIGAEESAEEFAVMPGSVIFVPARMTHQFHSIEAALTLLVIFAPAESN